MRFILTQNVTYVVFKGFIKLCGFIGIKRQGRAISEAAGPLDRCARAKGYIQNNSYEMPSYS